MAESSFAGTHPLVQVAGLQLGWNMFAPQFTTGLLQSLQKKISGWGLESKETCQSFPSFLTSSGVPFPLSHKWGLTQYRGKPFPQNTKLMALTSGVQKEQVQRICRVMGPETSRKFRSSLKSIFESNSEKYFLTFCKTKICLKPIFFKNIFFLFLNMF